MQCLREVLHIFSIHIDFCEFLQAQESKAKEAHKVFLRIEEGLNSSAVDKFSNYFGDKNYLKKSIPQTKKLIQEQILKLEKVRESLEGELEKINEEITRTMIEYQGKTG